MVVPGAPGFYYKKSLGFGPDKKKYYFFPTKIPPKFYHNLGKKTKKRISCSCGFAAAANFFLWLKLSDVIWSDWVGGRREKGERVCERGESRTRERKKEGGET